LPVAAGPSAAVVDAVSLRKLPSRVAALPPTSAPARLGVVVGTVPGTAMEATVVVMKVLAAR